MDEIVVLEVEETGERLDNFVSGKIPNLSRSRVQKLIKGGFVLVKGNKARQSCILKAGEEVKVVLPPPVSLTVEPEPGNIDILYEDNSLLVVNKPRGMVVHPAPGNEEGTLVHKLLYHCKNLSGIGGVLRPGIVHRLDRDTSGLLLVAKNDVAHIELSRQLKDREIKKEYLALALGRIYPAFVKIIAPIGRDTKHRKRMAVTSEGKEAITIIRVLARTKDFSLLKVNLKTGRTHQIRVHVSHIGHPLLGDSLYGGQSKIFKNLNWEGQALHARRISFVHPVTGEKMVFTSPIPADFKSLLKWCRSPVLI